MDNYIVSARKYRPKTFEDVVGQQSLTNTLEKAIVNHKLASAYLFCGPRGVGKTTCARIFAQAINCLNPHEDGSACQECESCISFNEQRSMNIQELNAAANNSVEDIRQIIDQVRVPPQLGKYKVIILDEVHMLSTAASNALLKTLEEPPTYVIFILATTEKQKMIPTILSRCQIFDFNRMNINDIVKELKIVAEKENIKYEEKALGIIADKADGGMRDALSIFDQVTNFSIGNITYESVLRCLNVLDYDYYFKMTDILLHHKIGGVMLLFNEIVNKGFNGGVFMGGFASHLRNLLVSRDKQTVQLLDVGETIKEQYLKQAEKCNEKFLYRAIRLCDRCSNEYRTSYNKRLSVEITLIEVAQIGDDDGSSGLGPTKELKPIFKETNISAKRTENTAPTQAKNSKDAILASETKPSAKFQPKAEQQHLEEKKNDLKTAVHSTPSIHLHTEKIKSSEATPQSKQEEKPLGQKPFTAEEVKTFWNKFAKALPAKQSALYGRMQEAIISLIDGTKVEASVTNAIAADFMKPSLNKIENYLRKELDNSDLTITLNVKVTKEQKLRYNPKQLLNKISSENEGFAKLKDELGLVID